MLLTAFVSAILATIVVGLTAAVDETTPPPAKYTMRQAIHEYGGLPLCHKYCLLRANSVETLIYHYTPLEFCATGEKMAHEVGDPAGVWIDRAVARCMAAECEAYDPDAAREAMEWRYRVCLAAMTPAATE